MAALPLQRLPSTLPARSGWTRLVFLVLEIGVALMIMALLYSAVSWLYNAPSAAALASVAGVAAGVSH